MREGFSNVVCRLERLAGRLERVGEVGRGWGCRTGEECSPARQCPIMPHVPVPGTEGRHPGPQPARIRPHRRS